MIGSLAGFKEYLGITGTDQDTILTAFLSSANSVLTKILQTNIEKATYTETLLGVCSNEIFLGTTPIAFPIYETDSWIKIDGEIVDEENFVFEASTGQVILKTSIPNKIETVEIKYEGGHDPVPDEVVFAVYEIAKTMNDARTRSGITSESMGDISVNYGGQDNVSTFQNLPNVVAVKCIYGHHNV